MSSRALTWAWGLRGLKPGEKLVLLCLADRADHRGICWPGAERVAEDCCMSRRAVLENLSRLEEKGLIARQARYRAGHRTSNSYALFISADSAHSKGEDSAHTVSADSAHTPKPAEQGAERAAGESAETLCADSAHTICADSAPEPITTSSNPPLSPRDFGLPETLTEGWTDFLNHRKKLKAPMSEEAQKRALLRLRRLADEGSDPERVLDQSIVNGWKGLFEDHERKKAPQRGVSRGNGARRESYPQQTSQERTRQDAEQYLRELYGT